MQSTAKHQITMLLHRIFEGLPQPEPDSHLGSFVCYHKSPNRSKDKKIAKRRFFYPSPQSGVATTPRLRHGFAMAWCKWLGESVRCTGFLCKNSRVQSSPPAEEYGVKRREVVFKFQLFCRKTTPPCSTGHPSTGWELWSAKKLMRYRPSAV